MKRTVFVVFLCLVLGGCGRRELEDRSFPTALTAETGNIRARQQERQAQSSKYIDYGHVKAVVLSKEAAEDAEALREILNYLESDPVFARSILMFVGDEEVICRAKEEEQDTGLYLEDLSKNQPGSGIPELPLKDLLDYLHNTAPSIEIPVLRMEGEEIVPGGSLKLTQEAAAASNVPVPRRVCEPEK